MPYVYVDITKFHYVAEKYDAIRGKRQDLFLLNTK